MWHQVLHHSTRVQEPLARHASTSSDDERYKEKAWFDRAAESLYAHLCCNTKANQTAHQFILCKQTRQIVV